MLTPAAVLYGAYDEDIKARSKCPGHSTGLSFEKYDLQGVEATCNCK
jgi:hypothetical protein